MSIIYEALKKTQSRLVRKENGPAPSIPISPTAVPALAQEPMTSSPVKKTPLALWLATSSIFWGFVFCGVIAVFLIYSSRQLSVLSAKTDQLASNKDTTTSELVKILTTPKNTPAAPNSTQTQAPAPTTLILNGIISTGDEQLALINNQILKAGDYINGKRVVSISADKVEILDNGEVIALTPTK